MSRLHIFRLIVGVTTLIGLILGYWVHPAYLLISAFVAVSLIQNAFTGFCPVETILVKYNIGKDDGTGCCR